MGLSLKKIAGTITKPIGGLLGGAVGTGGVTGSLLGGGANPLSSLTGGVATKLLGDPMSTLFGGEKYSPAEQAKANILNLGYEGLKKEMGIPVEDTAQSEINRGLSALEGSRGDSLRKIQSQIAARGLGTSSVGLNAIKSANQNIDIQKANLSASLPERLRQLRLQRIQLALGVGSPQATNVPGLAPLIGAGVGGALGGAPGAGIGMGAGQYASGMFGGQV